MCRARVVVRASRRRHGAGALLRPVAIMGSGPRYQIDEARAMHRRRIMRRSLLIALVACACGATSLAAQVSATPPDTLQAIEHARRAAREPVVGGYFLGGVVTGIAALGSFGSLIRSDGDLRPWMAAGPVAGTALSVAVRRSNLPLPASLEASLLGSDSAYVAVFRRTYDQTLQRRRARTAIAGMLTGAAAFVAYFVAALSTLDNS